MKNVRTNDVRENVVEQKLKVEWSVMQTLLEQIY